MINSIKLSISRNFYLPSGCYLRNTHNTSTAQVPYAPRERKRDHHSTRNDITTFTKPSHKLHSRASDHPTPHTLQRPKPHSTIIHNQSPSFTHGQSSFRIRHEHRMVEHTPNTVEAFVGGHLNAAPAHMHQSRCSVQWARCSRVRVLASIYLISLQTIRIVGVLYVEGFVVVEV